MQAPHAHRIIQPDGGGGAGEINVEGARPGFAVALPTLLIYLRLILKNCQDVLRKP
jgi:hypothetical protein